MNRIQVIVIVGFALAFAAGGAVGMLVRSGGAEQPVRGPDGLRHLAELGLTAEQRAEMRKIWSEVMGRQGRQQVRQRMEALRQQRTQAIEALLTDEQRKKYEEILADYAREMAKIREEGRRRIEQAVERTKDILTEEQAKKYEEMRKKWRRRGPGPPGSFRRGRRGGPRTRPGSRGPVGMGLGPFGRPGHWREGRRDMEAKVAAAHSTEP